MSQVFNIISDRVIDDPNFNRNVRINAFFSSMTKYKYKTQFNAECLWAKEMDSSEIYKIFGTVKAKTQSQMKIQSALPHIKCRINFSFVSKDLFNNEQGEGSGREK